MLRPTFALLWRLSNQGSKLFFMSDQLLTDTKQWLRKRRSQRIELIVPVVVHRPPKEGPQFSERSQTLVVNAHGALMALAEKVTPKAKALHAKHRQRGTERVPCGLHRESADG